MSRIILLLLAALALWYGWQYIKSKPPGQRKRLMWVLGTSGLLILSVLLVATGKMHWVGVALAALIPVVKTLSVWLVRLLPLLRLTGGRLSPSTISTRGLKVTFNFATGEASGEIFAGPHQGQNLGQLGESQLKEQLAFFQHTDRQSALLLQAYMVRKGLGGFSSPGQGSTDFDAPMSENEALQILGLQPGAAREEILKAHRRLIQKLHPDRGGNEYLAAKVNAARDKLTG